MKLKDLWITWLIWDKKTINNENYIVCSNLQWELILKKEVLFKKIYH